MSFQLQNHHWTLQTREKKIALSEIVKDHARAFYLYDLDDMVTRAEKFLSSGFSVHYAMKANSNPRVLRELARLGLGVDVVSLGEMQKALACGFSASRLIFSGIAKDREELEAALAHKVFQINCESFEELTLLAQICQERKTTADIAMRLNIHLTAPTHAHVQTTTPDSKFGIDITQLPSVLAWLKTQPQLRLKALATHIGSQIEDVSVFRAMAQQMGSLYKELKADGFPLERLDLGGGLGIDYRQSGENDLDRAGTYLQTLKEAHGTDAQILIEPGRFLVARMGVLLTKVIYVKQTSTQKFMILNAGMNCLMRPALYQAFHRITPIVTNSVLERYTVVGPICESTDKFAVDREMSAATRGDWVAIFDAGAYGASMANTYNESPLPEEWSYLNGQWEIT